MSLNRNSLIALAALAVTLSGCGTHNVTMVQARAVVQTSPIESKAIPPASAFVVIHGTVTKILPVDNQGLPHQNFVIDVDGKSMAVNNDTHYGSEVKGLAVGDKVEIKGVTYHNTKPTKDGIHWTHHADKSNDAGYIKTADGTIYQ